jgi:hypothetical protein
MANRGAPFDGKVYTGRLNNRELNDYRSEEMYEAIMTDLVNMGILSDAQFQQYVHRKIQSEVTPLKPQLDPFPSLPKDYYDPATYGGMPLRVDPDTGLVIPEVEKYDPSQYGGMQLVVDPDTGLVTPVPETGVFKQQFSGHIGIGVSIDPAGNPPPESGKVDNDYWYMLAWNNQWDMLEYRWFAAQNMWVFNASELVKAENFHYVMTWDDSDVRDHASGWFVLKTGDDSASLPTWQTLSPSGGSEVPNPLPISMGGTNAQSVEIARANLNIVDPPQLPLSVMQGGTGSTTPETARAALGITEPPALPISITDGGTGATTLDDARTALGIIDPPSLPLSVGNGGTGATTVVDVQQALGILQPPIQVVQGGTGAIDLADAQANLQIVDKFEPSFEGTPVVVGSYDSTLTGALATVEYVQMTDEHTERGEMVKNNTASLHEDVAHETSLSQTSRVAIQSDPTGVVAELKHDTNTSDNVRILLLNNGVNKRAYLLKDKTVPVVALNTDELLNKGEVDELVQQAIAGLGGGGLKVPVAIDLESSLPSPSLAEDGDYYKIGNMDITAPGSNGEAWFNSSVSTQAWQKLVDYAVPPDNVTIHLNQAGKLELMPDLVTSIDGAIQHSELPLRLDQGGTGASSSSEARTNLGIPSSLPVPVSEGGTGATTVAGAHSNLSIPDIPVDIEQGGTGATTVADAKTALGIPNLPISIANGGTGATSKEGAQTALEIPTASAPLAINHGGTGATTVADAKTVLGVPSLPVPVSEGGTGATDASTARVNLGIPDMPEIPVSVEQGGTGTDNGDSALANLGLYTDETEPWVPISRGGTGATSVDGAQNQLNVVSRSDPFFDNTPYLSTEGEPVYNPDIHGALATVQYVKDNVPALDLPLKIANGGTGATTLANARGVFGITQYTFIVNNVNDFNKWATNAAGNVYTHVFIAQGFIATQGVNLTTTKTRTITSGPGVVVSYNMSSVTASLFSYSTPSQLANDICGMYNVTVNCTASYGSGAIGFKNCFNLINCVALCSIGFDSCQNLTNCGMIFSKTGTNINPKAFNNCKYLVNCFFMSDTAQSYTQYNIGFITCSYLTNCVATAPSSLTSGIAFSGCKYCSYCVATGSNDWAVFTNCYADGGSIPVANTLIGGYNSSPTITSNNILPVANGGTGAPTRAEQTDFDTYFAFYEETFGDILENSIFYNAFNVRIFLTLELAGGRAINQEPVKFGSILPGAIELFDLSQLSFNIFGTAYSCNINEYDTFNKGARPAGSCYITPEGELYVMTSQGVFVNNNSIVQVDLTIPRVGIS